VDYAHSPATDVLPELLDQLNVEVVPLNARIDPNRISLSQDDFRAGLTQLARITGALHDISLGVRLDVGGERIFLVDGTGANVPNAVMCAAMAALVFQSYPGSTIAITVDQSQIFERLAARYGGNVRRCPVDSQALMEATAESGAIMGGDGTGGFVFPAFHPAIDGLMALGKLLELLALQGASLSEVVASLPPFCLASGEATGVWETKGRVMRCLLQQLSRLRHETVDGIKVYLDDNEWVLIRPDEETAVFHLVAEAKSVAIAQELIADYGGLVRSFVQVPCSDRLEPN
jgi:mannose-1-phosphate guanylyltransferase/phosphomannomutase